MQQYCGAKACQQARKNKWQREKLQTDPDYRVNKKESQQEWQKENPAYWRQYRSKHPEYQKHNQRLQQARDQKKRSRTTADHLAKKDALSQYFNDTSTTYYIYAGGGNLAKKDALSVKIIPITPG